MTKIPVSVVIPWSGDKVEFLECQLESLLGQSCDQQFEVLLSCNSEKALSLFSSLNNIPANFRVVDSSQVTGVVYARNKAAQYALGDKLLFCDADDIVARNWVQEMSLELENHDFAGCALDYNTLNGEQFSRSDFKAKMGLPNALNFLPYVSGCSQGFRKHVFQSISGFSPEAKFTEDIDISWRLQLDGKTIGFTNRTHVQYRLESGFRKAYVKHFNYGIGFAALAKRYRKLGARQYWRDTTTDIAKSVGALFMFLPLSSRRNKAGFIWGFLAGRIVGSYRYRVKAF